MFFQQIIRSSAQFLTSFCNKSNKAITVATITTIPDNIFIINLNSLFISHILYYVFNIFVHNNFDFIFILFDNILHNFVNMPITISKVKTIIIAAVIYV